MNSIFLLAMNECEFIIVLIGVLVLLCIIIDILKKYVKDGFVSKEAMELCNISKKLLSKDDKISFTDFRYKTGCSDVVVYDDIKKLYNKGNLTPKAVQAIL